MVRAESSTIVRLSTRDVAPADRLNYASWILSSALAPSALSAGNPSEYELEVTALELPSIAIVAQRGSPQRSIRARSEIRRTSERYFFSGSGTQRFMARHACDAQPVRPWRPHLLRFAPPARLRLSAQLERFVSAAVGTVRAQMGAQSCRAGWAAICRDSQWGRVLASYVAQLSPEFVVQAPLPQAVLIDQLGALLALTASELSGRRAVSTPAERSVRDQVYDHIRQRCADTSLHAADVASSLNISTRTLHRALAACGETFGAMLIQARVDLAVRMLQSPLFDRVTTAEIGRRAGFSDASHFVKVLRRLTGQTPLQMRRTRH